MAKWIEGALAAMIWSWFMLLMIMKEALKKKQQVLANPCRPVSRNNVHLNNGQLTLHGHSARLRA